MGSARVVPMNPPADAVVSLLEGVKPLEPDALLFDASEEALDEAVLLRRIRRDELLGLSLIHI